MCSNEHLDKVYIKIFRSKTTNQELFHETEEEEEADEAKGEKKGLQESNK